MTRFIELLEEKMRKKRQRDKDPFEDLIAWIKKNIIGFWAPIAVILLGLAQLTGFL